MSQSLEMIGYKRELIVVTDPLENQQDKDSDQSPDFELDPEEADRLREFFEILNSINEREKIC